MTPRPVTDVLVKPAGPDCNLACDYCFYSGKEAFFPGAKTRMSGEVLEALMRQLMGQPVPQISMGWQGGEPTLMGLPFFEKAVGYMKRFGDGKAVSNGLQTNGMLIDKSWARFFKKYSFLVGLSIDGPEHVHDHYRKNHGGLGSWRKVSDAARLMLDAGVEVNALTVVNDYSQRFPEEIYSFHKSLGLPFMQFIPCVEPDAWDPGKAAPFSAGGEGYGNFLCKIFDLWLADFSDGKPTTSIRFFESLLFRYAGFPAPECTLQEECGGYVVVEHNGDVYACDFFVEPAWRLGNLLDTPLTDLLNSDRQREFGAMKRDLHADCLPCAWKELCRGGCTKDRLRDSPDGGLNHFCAAFRIFFPHADPHLRRLADEWTQAHGAPKP
ncbi:MAG: anaerobic sulfatase maturase [Spirochaetes bacterium]|nr:MAG: anaerobic sulfatase maturase [Spirochaetota bacterium]